MMKGIVQIDTMKVRELKELLNQFDDELDVMDSCYNDIDGVVEGVWEHTNYPYNLPDKRVVLLI